MYKQGLVIAHVVCVKREGMGPMANMLLVQA
jgi:hypothetical protein